MLLLFRALFRALYLLFIFCSLFSLLCSVFAFLFFFFSYSLLLHFFQTSFKKRHRRRDARYHHKEMESSIKAVVGTAQLARAARDAAMDMSVNIFEGWFKFL